MLCRKKNSKPKLKKQNINLTNCHRVVSQTWAMFLKPFWLLVFHVVQWWSLKERQNWWKRDLRKNKNYSMVLSKVSLLPWRHSKLRSVLLPKKLKCKCRILTSSRIVFRMLKSELEMNKSSTLKTCRKLPEFLRSWLQHVMTWSKKPKSKPRTSQT